MLHRLYFISLSFTDSFQSFLSPLFLINTIPAASSIKKKKKKKKKVALISSVALRCFITLCWLA